MEHGGSMRGREVRFVELRERRELVPVKDHFEFKPSGRLQRLQRWAWRFLHWRGALRQAFDETVSYTQHVINTDDVMRRLMEQRRGLFDYGQEPRELLIGAEDFAELMSQPQIHNYMDFGAEYVSGRRIMGLKVRVIPWMRGMLVMPKEE
jgi:hypothetical protein